MPGKVTDAMIRAGMHLAGSTSGKVTIEETFAALGHDISEAEFEAAVGVATKAALAYEQRPGGEAAVPTLAIVLLTTGIELERARAFAAANTEET